MIYLIGYNLDKMIVFKYGVDDGLILVMLLGYDVRCEDGIKYWFMLGQCLDLTF